jgi:ABC-2 type transport system ATP-binding protein
MIKIHNLSKRYPNTLALDRLTMEIAPGEVLGFIGPNGAGKTTTLKILATLLHPTAGSAEIDGHSVLRQPAKVRALLGYMPDFCGVYEDMRVREYLHFFAAAYGVKAADAGRMVQDVLTLTDLTGKADAMADSLSRGMAQRLQLARVLLHNPKVLLLDEPASGLDPRARIEMRMLLKELRSMGKTILVSSHILPELADLCTSIAIIEKGRLVYHGNVADALAQAAKFSVRRIFVAVAERPDEARALLQGQAGIESILERDGTFELETSDEWTTARLFDCLTGAGFRLTRLDDARINLEDAFMHLTKGQVS